MTDNQSFDFICAGCAAGEGIYRFSAVGGRLEKKGEITGIDEVMYFVREGGKLHVLLRAPEGFGGCGGYIAINEDASSAGMKDAVSTGGTVSCHLSVDGGDVYAANYTGSCVSHVGKKVLYHVPYRNMQPGRQEKPHPHCTILSPDKKYVLATDLGLDRIFVYDRQLDLCSVAETEKGHGVRHILFHPDGRTLYAVNELASTVSVFSWDDGRLMLLMTYSCNICHPKNTAAAIRLSPDARRLYVSHRGQDVITCFGVSEDGRTLSFVSNSDCGGAGPRDFCLSPDGKFIVTANERSGNIALLEIGDDGAMKVLDRADVKAALCVLA